MGWVLSPTCAATTPGSGQSPVRIDEITFLTDTRQLTQLQLSYAGDRLNWIVGGFAFDENFDSHSEADLLGEVAALAIPLITDARRDNTSYAVFGQGTYDLSERARLTVGGRYTIDKVSIRHREYLIPGRFDANIPDAPEIAFLPLKRDRDTWRTFSWRAALDYDVSDDLLVYASVHRAASRRAATTSASCSARPSAPRSTRNTDV